MQTQGCIKKIEGARDMEHNENKSYIFLFIELLLILAILFWAHSMNFEGLRKFIWGVYAIIAMVFAKRSSGSFGDFISLSWRLALFPVAIWGMNMLTVYCFEIGLELYNTFAPIIAMPVFIWLIQDITATRERVFARKVAKKELANAK